MLRRSRHALGHLAQRLRRRSAQNGRSIAPGPRRRRFIELHVELGAASILEIGAFDQPTYRADEARVRFFDRYGLGELDDKYGKVETRTMSGAVRPDYVSKSKHFAEEIDERFDLVIANHVLEHVADPLTWLEQVGRLTRPGGHLFMALPDKRYTFDILRRETSLSDWLSWRALDLEKPSATQLFDCLYYHRPIRHMDVWNDRIADKLDEARFDAEDAWRRAQLHAAEPAPDTHCSVFTEASFDTLWRGASELGLPWKRIGGEGVVFGTNEFLVLLRRS